MAYEVSSSIAAGTNYLQLVTNTTGSKSAGGHFSPDGTKLAAPSQRINGSGTDDYGLDIFTSSSLNGWQRTEYIDTGVAQTVNAFQWRSDSEIIGVISGFGLHSFTSGASGWSTPVKCFPSSISYPGSIIFSPNGNRFINAEKNTTYFRVFTTGSTQWDLGTSVNVANRIQSWAWIDDETIMIGIPEGGPSDYSSHGELLVFQADDATDTSFTQVESLNGEPGDQLGAAIYYQTSSGNFIVGTDKDRSFTATTTDLSSSLFVYNSPGGGTYLPADNSGRTEITSSARTFYGHYVAGERNDDSRAYMLSKNDSGLVNDAGAELIALESGSAGWKVTKIDDQVRFEAVGTSRYSSAFETIISSNGTALVTNNSNYTDSAFNVHYVALPSSAGSALTNTTTSSVGTGGGLVKAGNSTSDPDAQVNIPASALSGDTSIIVKIKQTASDKADAVTEIKQLASVPKGARAVSDIVAFEPHGQTFTSDAILSWNITGSTTGLKVYRRANPSSPWAEVDSSYYSFNGGQVHVTSSTFSEYMVIGGISSVAITKIGTKLIGDGTITTVKLGSSAVTRSDIQSGSVQVTHLDVNQGAGTHVDFLDDDFLIAGDATSNDARGFSFSQLKTALSLSNAARGNPTSVQYNNGSGFDGIAKIVTDGVHLTASDSGKVVLAFTGISGSTGELYADSKTGLTLEAKTRLSFHSSGSNSTQGNQSGSVELRADGLFPSVKPAVAAQPGTFRFTFTSGGFGGANRTYSPVTTYNSQLITVLGTGSQAYIFYIDNAAGNAPLPVSASLNLEYTSFASGKKRFDIPVQGETGVTDWRNVVTNFYNAMNTTIPSGLASVTYNQTSSINGTASIEVTYNSAAGIQGQLNRGSSFTGASSDDSISAAADGTNSRFYARADSDQTTPEQNGVSISTIVAGSAAIDEVTVWLNLGQSNRKYNEVHASVISGSGNNSFHKLDTDEVTANRIIQSRRDSELSGSGTATLHNLTVEEGTFGGVKFSSVRDAAAYATTGSGTANLHKIDADLGTIDRVSSLVLTGSKTSEIHKLDSDLGTIDRVVSLVVTGSGTSQIHKLDVDEGDFRKVITTNLTSSGLAQLHNMVASDVSGAVGEFHHLNVDHLNARVINSTTDTVEHLEVNVKQLIPAVSQSAGAAQEGAGLQIGGTAGSGSAGIASVILGDAGSGAGADLLFKVGSVQGASLSGSANEPLQRFGVSGSISGSIGVFHEVTINQSLGAQDSIFSGSSFTGHLLSGSTAQAHFLNADEAQVADISGSAMTYNVITGSEINTHVADADTATLADVSGSTVTYHTLSGSTLNANLAQVDRLTSGDVDVAGAISGSATSTLHKLTSNDVSGSHIEVHELGSAATYSDYIDNLVVKDLQGNDVIKKASLNNDIVKDDDNIHGGIVFNNGQLSVGWKRRIFSRSTKALINRTQPTQGSGSLYTTCSLSAERMVSGSESVYFNGLLLTKDNGAQGNPQKGDYTIDYNGGGGLQKGTFRFVFYSGSVGRNSNGEFNVKRYGPTETYVAQLLGVQSTGSSNSEYYLFYLSGSDDNTPLPISASANLEYSNLAPGKKRHDIPVEAISGVTDWRDVVTNFYNAMNTELNTNAGLATVTLNSTSSINGTASIEITYTADIEGQIFAGDGGTRNNGTNGEYNNTSDTQLFSPSNTPPIGAGYANIYNTSVRSGVETEIIVSGSTIIPGTEIFLSENLAMDSDDVLVVQYLSGSHRFG